MGAYLSEPVTETISSDEKTERLTVGASSMQGWRISQEDAHACCLNYDKDSALFAVFDGHGGAEVAQYSAANLPRFLKQTPSYKEGKFADALKEAFIDFDASLLRPNVIKELKALAGNMSEDEADEDENDANEASLLMEEASIPIEDLIARYGSNEESIKPDYLSSQSNKGLPSHMKKEMSKDKPLSPYLRAKQTNNGNKEAEPNCGSDTCSSSSSKPSDSLCEAACSSSCLVNGEAESHKEDSKPKNECESVSSSSSAEACSHKSEVDTDNNNVSSSKNDDSNDAKFNENISDSIPSSTSHAKKASPSGSNNLSNNSNNDEDNGEEPTHGVSDEQEGNVSTSSEARSSPVKDADKDLKDDSQKPSSTDKPEDQPSSAKGKGKQKKIVIKAPAEEKVLDPQPVYKAFLKDFTEDSASESEEDLTEDYKDALQNSDSEEEGVQVDDEEEDSSEDEDDDDDDDDDDEEEEVNVPKSSKMLLRATTEEPGKDSGCTAVVALLRGNELYVANAGDSRCVVSRLGKAIEMSFDHKPEDDIERERIRKAGGKITGDGRVNGGLNLSRAIGDHAYKDNRSLSLKEQMITAFPDIRTLTIEPEKDEFMVLACDGIWNSMTSQQVIDFVSERIKNRDKTKGDDWKLSEICEELFHECLSPNTMGDGTGCDNMTCVIVRFNHSRKRRADSDENDTLDGSEDVENGSVDGSSANKRQRTAAQLN